LTGSYKAASTSRSVPITSTGNDGLDLLADAIAERVFQRLSAAHEHSRTRLLDVPAAAEYIGRTPSALRHLIAKGAIPCVRRDGRVQIDRQDLDTWLEMGKTRG
jgi:excisionase family DNA binding protein